MARGENALAARRAKKSWDRTMIIIVMGVSGCGKSTIAQNMAQQLGIDFLDADDLHPPENKRRMSAGIALTDENRWPWLHKVRDYAIEHTASNQDAVIACSALKKSYRNILNEALATSYVYLTGPRSLIESRMHARTGHFMPESLLDSQIATLEPPLAEPNVVSISIRGNPDEIAEAAVSALKRAHFL